MLKKMMVLLIVTGLLAGCAEAIPDAPGTIIEETPVGWEEINGTYTVLIGDNNSTAPTIVVGNNSTWLKVHSINLNATHLSFEVVNNSIIFSNFTFDLDGYLIQDGDKFSNGFAPNMGTANLYTPPFPYNITVEYVIVYRELVG